MEFRMNLFILQRCTTTIINVQFKKKLLNRDTKRFILIPHTAGWWRLLMISLKFSLCGCWAVLVFGWCMLFINGMLGSDCDLEELLLELQVSGRRHFWLHPKMWIPFWRKCCVVESLQYYSSKLGTKIFF